MADDEWQLIKCASCNGLIRLDPKQSAPVATCPLCNTQIVVPGANNDDVPVAELAVGEPTRTNSRSLSASASASSRLDRNTKEIPLPGKKEKREKEKKPFEFTAKRSVDSLSSSASSPSAPEEVAAPAVNNEAEVEAEAKPALDSHLPPEKEKAAFEIQSGVIRNTNRPTHEIESKAADLPSDKPRLDNLQKLASTGESRFAADEEAQEKIVTETRIRRAERQLVTWEDGDEEGSGKKVTHPFRRVVTFAAFGLIIGLFGGLVAYGVISNTNNRADRETPVLEIEEDELEYAEMAKDDVGQSIAAVEEFLNASTWRDRLKFCRAPERISPLAEEHYRGKPDGPIAFREIQDGAKAQLYENFFVTRVVLDDFSERIVAVEKTDDERLLVDWESFVAYCEVPWPEIRKRKPTSAVLMRITAIQDSYFNFDFESDAYACFRLQSQDGAHTIYGYTQRGSLVYQ
ncbi:MAG: hypothetical protein AAGJ79_08530, partial [Verrucomicrobiota bacterium]